MTNEPTSFCRNEGTDLLSCFRCSGSEVAKEVWATETETRWQKKSSKCANMMPTRLVSHNIIKTEYKTYEKLSLRLAIIVVLRVVICLFEFLVLSLEKRSQ